MERHLRGYSRGISVKKKARKIGNFKISQTEGAPFQKWIGALFLYFSCVRHGETLRSAMRNCETPRRNLYDCVILILIINFFSK